jgi:hypothetical protein
MRRSSLRGAPRLPHLSDRLGKPGKIGRLDIPVKNVSEAVKNGAASGPS